MVIIKNMRAKQIKTKICCLKSILIWSDRRYLSDMINDHKAPEIFKVHSSDEVF